MPALVSSRLHLIPRFRKKIARVPFDAGMPIWVDDEHFDIGYHVRLTALPSPGSRSELLALFERVQAQMLDRSRPLWELWFVEGLEGGHVALIQKTHHSLVDGVSGVDVATVLLDFEQETAVVDAPEWRPEATPPPARCWSTRSRSTWTDRVRWRRRRAPPSRCRVGRRTRSRSSRDRSRR